MGIAIANVAANLGAEVTLVLGPSNQVVNHQAIKVVRVINAQEMYLACEKVFGEVNYVIFSAAVADYRPLEMAKQKIKKDDANMTIELTKNIDIAATLGSKKQSHQTIVGFALETNDEESNAIKKIHKKNFDFVVLNSLNDKGAGFGIDTNKITIIHKDGSKIDFGVKSKNEVAQDIINEIIRINDK
jgi:phosphopantothenoylcysteine decarboxylase/phosphopantothenate--cysteine ligase